MMYSFYSIVDTPDEHGNGSLHRATVHEDASLIGSFCLRFCIEVPLNTMPLDINVRNKFGETPLHLAARYNNADAVQTLLYAGADINHRDKSGDTPLHKAAESNVAEVVMLLLYQGADPTIRTLVSNVI